MDEKKFAEDFEKTENKSPDDSKSDNKPISYKIISNSLEHEGNIIDFDTLLDPADFPKKDNGTDEEFKIINDDKARGERFVTVSINVITDPEKMKEIKERCESKKKAEKPKCAVTQHDGFYIASRIEDMKEVERESIIVHNRKLFDERREEFYRTMRRYGYPMSSGVTKSLRALGEITLNEAVDLEFYFSLPGDIRAMYFAQQAFDHSKAIAEYVELANDLRNAALVMGARTLNAKSHLERSKRYTLPKHLKISANGVFTDIVEPMRNWEREMSATKSSITTINQVADEIANDYEKPVEVVWEDVKEKAKLSMKTARNIRNFLIAEGSDDGLILYETIRILRTTMPSEATKYLRHYKKENKKLEREFEYEVEHFI